MIKHLWSSIARETTIAGELVTRAEMAFCEVGERHGRIRSGHKTRHYNSIDQHLR